MKAILLTAIALVATTAPSLARSQNGQPLQFVDLTDEFDRAWEQTKNLPDTTRVEAFETDFARVVPGFYDYRRVSEFLSRDAYQTRVLEGLKAYPGQRAGIQRVSREFRSLIEPAQRTFEASFGPMRGYAPVYLVNSLGEFDGGTRDLSDGVHLMFGADMIDKYHVSTAIQPFFHHELFHLYHHQFFHDCGPLWCNLWTEGLAVYVASELNPSADDAALLLTIPEPIRPAVERDRRGAICSVVGKLGSTKSADRAALFQGRSQPGAAFPPRYGYYVGYLVAKDLGRTRSLKELASLTAAQAGPLVEASLRGMADCPLASAPGERG